MNPCYHDHPKAEGPQTTIVMEIIHIKIKINIDTTAPNFQGRPRNICMTVGIPPKIAKRGKIMKPKSRQNSQSVGGVKTPPIEAVKN